MTSRAKHESNDLGELSVRMGVRVMIGVALWKFLRDAWEGRHGLV